MKNLPKNLIKLRKSIGMSTFIVARNMNIPENKYIDFEKGIKQPSLTELNRLAFIFNTTVNELLNEPEPFQKDIERASKKGSEEIKYVNNIIDTFFKNKALYEKNR